MNDLTYLCAKCSMQLLDLRPANLVVQKPELDDLLVCGTCNTINSVTLLGTRELAADEYEKLDDETKADLAFALRAIKRNVQNS